MSRHVSRALAVMVVAAGLVSTGVARTQGGDAAGSTPLDPFERILGKARALAAEPYAPEAFDPPPALAALTYDEYRDIRFRPERSLWRDRDKPFELMFFHLGKYQLHPVRVNAIEEDGRVAPVIFDSTDFDYGGNTLGDVLTRPDLGFAGFRAHYALNSPEYLDELIVFLGASYFRALGAGQRYGLSARGLAIDTVGGDGEEFPRFVEFWVQAPAEDAASLTVYALLDSPSVAGAYAFDIHPGAQTTIDVHAQLFPRTAIATLGVAPLTSMYAFGENQPNAEDFRPEVHDSDGLLVASGDGEWLWRPLVNPRAPLVTSFAMAAPRGFGLIQRDRRFDAYEDNEARYDLRPSLWVEPLGDWGPGRVELVQLPTPDETQDNIVAYWVPAEAITPDRPLRFTYRLHWQGAQREEPTRGWVAQTRAGRGYASLGPGEHQFVVDFTGPALTTLPAGASVEAVVSASSSGVILEQNAYRLEANGAWRMLLRVRREDPTEALELRGFLRSCDDTLTETWSYVLPPE
ncbi:MAG: glucan biosynthesis protein G [Pseudomonadota bacterium]